MAAVTAIRLGKFFYSVISQIQHFWSDNQIIVHWAHKDTHSKLFIDHHVQQIKNLGILFLQLAGHVFRRLIIQLTYILLTREISTIQPRASHVWTGADLGFLEGGFY